MTIRPVYAFLKDAREKKLLTIHQLHMHLPGMFYCDYCRLQNLTGTYRYSEMNVTDLGFPANLALGILQASSQRRSVEQVLDAPKQSIAVYHRLSARLRRLDQQDSGTLSIIELRTSVRDLCRQPFVYLPSSLINLSSTTPATTRRLAVALQRTNTASAKGIATSCGT